ncbi:MAG: anti-sigma factor [Moraxellaceae bacterium]
MSGSDSNTAAAEYPLSLIAAQYVLGVLSGSARAQVQTRMLHDIALRDSVYQWERKLNPLASLLPEQPVPAHVWQAIERQLGHAAPVVATPPLQMTQQPSTQAPANDVSRWKLWTGLSSAVAAGLALALMLRPDTVITPTEPPILVAQPAAIRDLTVLVDADNVPTWIVRQQEQQLLLSSLTAQQIPSDRDLELWTIQGDQAPKSLGVIPVRDGQAVLGNIASTLVSADSVLAISIEPKNGSPTGAPTGAVLFTGKIRA